MKAFLPLLALLGGVILVGCGSPEPAPDTSQVVDQSKAPPMDGGVSAEGAAPAGGAAAQNNNEGS